MTHTALARVRSALTTLKCWSHPKPTKVARILLLPDSLLVIILSKLDIKSLCRVTIASREFLPILPLITHISTPLPSPFQKQQQSKSRWSHSSLNYDVGNFLPCRESPDPTTGFVNPFSHIYMMHSFPHISPCLTFFRVALTGLTSLDIQLPAPPSAQNLTHPGSRHKWDGELSLSRDHDNNKPVVTGFFVFVSGNVIEKKQGWFFGWGKREPFEDDVDRIVFARDHLTNHWLTAMKLLMKKEDGVEHVLRRVVSRDVKKNGKLRACCDAGFNDAMGIVSKEEMKNYFVDERRLREKACWVPGLLEVNSGNGCFKLEDATLMFVAWVDEDDKTDIVDLIKDRLGFGAGDDELEADDERKELREIVREILAAKGWL